MTVRVQEWAVIPPLAAWVLCGCTCVKEPSPHTNASSRAEEQPVVEVETRATPSLHELLEKALKAEGNAYFEAIAAIIERQGARESIRERLRSDGSTPRERALGRAIASRLGDPAKHMAMEKKVLVLIQDPSRHKRAIPKAWKDGRFWFGNPRDFPRDCDAARTFAVFNELGLAAEMLFAHDGDSLTERAAMLAAERSRLRYEQQLAQGSKSIIGPSSAEYFMRQTKPSARRGRLIDAWRLATRALAFAGSDEAVGLLEEAAGMGERGVLAVKCLGYIGNDAAKASLRRIGTPRAQTVLQRLEAEEKKRR